MNKRIILACPVQNREFILPYYLERIYNLQYNKKLISIYWIVNNSTDNSLQLLKEFKAKYQQEYNSITIEILNDDSIPLDNRSAEIRNKTYHFLSKLRNKIISKCANGNYDYLFSCDSDILISPNTLQRLIDANKDVTCGLIWNGYIFDKENPYKFPNILNRNSTGQYEHIVNYYVKNPDKVEGQKLIKVDASGAIALISHKVCQTSSYTWHPQGEDMSWSESVYQNGYEIWCDLGCFSNHIMSKELLEEYMRNQNKI